MTKKRSGPLTIYTDHHGRVSAWVGTHLIGLWLTAFEAGYWLSANGWLDIGSE